ncbi:MAG: hypothetical protein KatS3mg088_294 [Patescibacteria group bacterium]|nr:MAG: hypothetical protein KatS3mg088_294 [Patescibacteria group bacterium]
MKEFLTSKRFMLIASFVGLYLFSTGASLAIFSFLKGDSGVDNIDLSGNVSEVRSKIGEGLPKTEECPINGALYSKPERAIWEKRRPIAVMIENSVDARPQSGISKADVVYEAVAEGGVTRFLAIFYCGAAAEDVKVAPVRSARVYFIDWAAAYGKNPIFMHVGGANDFAGTGDTAKEARALELLQTLGWRVPQGNDFDTTYDSGYPVFWRNYDRLDHQVATEHTMMASLDAAYKQAEKRGFTNKDKNGVSWDINFKPWRFTDGKPQSQIVKEISFEFWANKPDYAVSWKYNPAENSYLRFNGGVEHKDHETKEQIKAKNVVILFTKEQSSVDKNKHSLYTTIGKGEALVFQNGEVIEATWQKDSRESMIVFKDKKGKEISFVRGPIWIEVLAIGSKVNY